MSVIIDTCPSSPIISLNIKRSGIFYRTKWDFMRMRILKNPSWCNERDRNSPKINCAMFDTHRKSIGTILLHNGVTRFSVYFKYHLLIIKNTLAFDLQLLLNHVKRSNKCYAVVVLHRPLTLLNELNFWICCVKPT
jgi:hypothetical protein